MSLQNTDKQTEKKEKKSFSVSRPTLQILAVVTMIIDHFCYSIALPYLYTLPYDRVWRYIKAASWIRNTVGRFAFPVYCFFLAEGFFRTRNRKKYFGRLLLLLVLSEIPFDYALSGRFNNGYQSVMFTLVIAFLVMAAQDKVTASLREKGPLPVFLAQALLVGAGMALAHFLHSDYAWHGVLLADIFYLGIYWNLDRGTTCLLGFLDMSYEPFALISFIMLKYYDGKKVKQSRLGKTAYTLAYPLHLAVLAVLRVFVLKL